MKVTVLPDGFSDQTIYEALLEVNFPVAIGRSSEQPRLGSKWLLYLPVDIVQRKLAPTGHNLVHFEDAVRGIFQVEFFNQCTLLGQIGSDAMVVYCFQIRLSVKVLARQEIETKIRDLAAQLGIRIWE